MKGKNKFQMSIEQKTKWTEADEEASLKTTDGRTDATVIVK